MDTQLGLEHRRAPLAESLLSKVRALPGVAAAIGGVGGEAHLIGRNGKVINFDGAPHIGFSVDPTQPQFNTMILVRGGWPGKDEVAIDTSTASRKHIEVGNHIGVRGRAATTPMRVSGLFKFSSAGNIGGATLTALDLKTAQKLFQTEGKLHQIRVAAKPGVSRAELLSQIRAIPPPAAQARAA